MAHDENIEEDKGDDTGMEQLGGGISADLTSKDSRDRPNVQEQGSGQFTNIQKYIKGPAGVGGQKMAEKIGAGYKATGQGIQDNAAEKVSNFNTQYNTENDRLQTASDRVGQYIQEAGTQDEETRANRANEIQTLRSGEYVNPLGQQEGVDLSEQKLAESNFRRNALNSLSDSSIQKSLSKHFQQPDYSKGERSLDFLALQQKPAQQTIQREVRAAADKLANYNLTDTQEDTRQRDVDLGNLARSYGADGERDIAPRIRSAEDILSGVIEGRRQEAENKRIAERSYLESLQVNSQSGATSPRAMQDYYKSHGFAAPEADETPEQLAQRQAFEESTGITEGFSSYGVDPSKYMNNTDVFASDVVSEDEIARYGALARLAGRPETAQLTEQQQMGDLFRKEDFLRDVGASEAAIEKLLNQPFYEEGEAKEITFYRNLIKKNIEIRKKLADPTGAVGRTYNSAKKAVRNVISDKRAKTNIKPAKNSIDKLIQLKKQ